MENEMSLRLFVAMDVPGGLKEEMGRAMEETAAAAAGLKWVRPENIHLTMKFLGNVEEEKLAEFKKTLRETADAQAAIELSVGGYGAFPHPRRARVFWLGLEGGRSELAGLACKLDKRLAKLGFPAENRPFAAHVTLARLRQPHDITKILEAWEAKHGIKGTAWRGEELVLYRSMLNGTGPCYTALERFMFKG